MDRDDFMAFFRDTEKLNTLSADDRQELFRYSLVGSSDLTKELLTEVLSDYCVDNITVVDTDAIGYYKHVIDKLKNPKIEHRYTIAKRISMCLNNSPTTNASRGRLISLFDTDCLLVEDVLRIDLLNDLDVEEYVVKFIDGSVLYYCEGTTRVL